jgi:hypothetical protein
MSRAVKGFMFYLIIYVVSIEILLPELKLLI